MKTSHGLALAACAAAAVTCGASGAAEVFPAADWRSGPPETVVAPADLQYPGTFAVSRKGPGPMVVTIAGTAERPVPYGVGSITMGLSYHDGCYCWGNRTALDFSRGGRQESKITVLSSHRLASVFAYYGAPKGVRLEPPRYAFFEPRGDAILDGVPVKAPSGLGKASFLVRDVRAESGFARVADGQTVKGLRFSGTAEARDGARFLAGRLVDRTRKDRAVTLLYAVPLPEGEIVWWDDPRTSRVADPAKLNEHDNTWGEECGRGPHSRWPIGAVTVGGRGIAIGIDPMKPAYYRIGLNPKLRLLCIAYDIGLASPERDFADVSLAVFGFPAAEGFRGALEKYHRLYPEAFVSRVTRHGCWVPFEPLSKLAGGVEDFRFRFNEYMWDTDFDDRHDILSLRYQEPCTWWMKLKNASGGLPSYAECLAFAQEQLKKGVPDAKAWETSVFKDRFGRPTGMILNKPWCFGIAWSMNAAPGLRGELTEYTFKQGEKDFQANYGATEFPKGCDGEYVDSAELACTVAADYDRRHFAGMKAPLTFSQDELRPVVFKGLSVWDYCQDISRRLRARNRVLFANATPNHWSYLTPVMDAVGIEIGWGDGGTWKPDGPEQLLYWRAVSGLKPYCFLMTNGPKFTREMTEKFMKTSLAYGLIPGFQSNYFFDGGNRHERDRDLWRKYMPIICRVSEAGWRPVNRLASCAGAGIVCEQFGDGLLTLFNHGTERQSAALTFRAGGAVAVRDLVSGRPVKVEGRSASLVLGPEDVAVLDVRKVEDLVRTRTLYLGDETAAAAGAGKADATTRAYDGATTRDLLREIDGGALDPVEPETVELFIGLNNVLTKAYADETPLDTVIGVREIATALRKQYPNAMIWINPLAYAADDDAATKVRKYAINRACVEVNEGDRGRMFMRQPDWMYAYPDGKNPWPDGYISRYWLSNAKDPRLKRKLAEKRSHARKAAAYDAVLVGDSVTHFWEDVNGRDYFAQEIAPSWDVFNLGFGGDCTCHTIWNLRYSGLFDGYTASVFTVLIGNNNISETTTDGELEKVAGECKAILEILRAKHPESKIVLLPLLPRGNQPGVLRTLNAKYNALIRAHADGTNVVWAGELWDRILATADANGVIPKSVLCDGIHPGKEGYRIYGEVLKRHLPRKDNQKQADRKAK